MAGGGCSDCGRKGGCESRKSGSAATVEEALARLYPTRRWGERDDAAAWGAGVSPEEGAELARRLAAKLRALTLYRPGAPDEPCDYVYVLCVGRTPCLAELREGAVPDARIELGDEGGPVQELYLRVALSQLARVAAVQQVAMTLDRESDALVITERPRAGVFDPVLLRRFQALVAVLVEADIRHLDFGELVEPPPAFEPGDYALRYQSEPAVANYLFYPQPCTAVTTSVLGAPGART